MTYRDPRPHTKIGQVRTALMYLLDQRRRDGALPTSVRFLFYELVMQRIISKSGDRPDKIVSAALIDLRGHGFVVPEGKNVPTRDVSTCFATQPKFQSLDSIGAKSAVPERLNPLAIFVLAMNPPVAEHPLNGTLHLREHLAVVQPILIR